MKKTSTLFAGALMLALLCGCESLEEISKGSGDAVVEDANAQIKSQRPAAQQPARELKSANTAAAKAPAEALRSEEKAKDLGTIVPAVSPAPENQEAGEPQEDGDSTIPTGLLPPVDESTAGAIAELPDYATVSGRQTCPVELNAAAQTAASSLAAQLLSKLSSDSGAMYAAPTVIPDEFSDCIRDVSSYVRDEISKSGRFTAAKGGDVRVAQNSGSSSLIPRTVRECRRLGIPYLAVSVVRKLGGNAALTVRIIRVNTGVTLTQAYKKLN